MLTRTPSKVAHWESKVEVAIGDLSKPETLPAAVQGVKAIFLLVAGDADGTPCVRNMVAAAKANGRVRIVLLSSLGASEPDIELARQHALRERIVKESALEWTVLRPGMFMSNTLQWARSIKAEKAVYTAHGEGKTAPVAPADIAAVAVKALTTESLIGQTLEITGAELMTTPEQVEKLAGVLGLPIRAVGITVEAMMEGMIKNGLPENFVRLLGELNVRVREGNAATVSDTVEKVTGHKPITFNTWARDNAGAWQ